VVARMDRDAQIDLHPIESAAGEQALGHVDSAERYGSMHLVTADGHRLAGGAALPELMALIPGAAAFAPVARAVPEWALERAYRMVADHRHTLSRLAGHARCGLR
jgi:predicted DCC family thiol-disulfide oxidoreductase YuxK